MKVETFDNRHNGVSYKGAKIPCPIEATVCLDDKSKIVIKGVLSMVLLGCGWWRCADE